MAPTSVRVYDNSLALESEIKDPQQFYTLSDFIMKKDCSQDEKQISVDPISVRSVLSSPRIDSSNIMLPPAMSPPRDFTVPLPLPAKPVKIKKKLSKQESLLFLKKHYSFNHNNSSRKNDKKLKKSESFDSSDEDIDFKCVPFCMFRPSFGKPKTVRPSDTLQGVFSENDRKSIISALDAMERFECESWASSVLADDKEKFSGDSPAGETVKRSSGELRKPISSGCVFDKEPVAIKGVLKTSSSARRSADSSPRRVRFATTMSVSCPASPRSCVTPRLRKAREDFNAFLEAQNA